MNPLEDVSTDDLVEELRVRSRALFVAMRPLGENREYSALVCVGVDGKKVETGEGRDRVLGLAFQAMQQIGTKWVEDET